MKETTKKKSTLFSSISNNGSKENILKVERSSNQRKSTYAPPRTNLNPSQYRSNKRLSVVSDIGEIKILHDSVKDNNEKKFLQSNSISQTNFNSTATHNSDIKTTQIKVVARFRPVNMVEEVYSKKAEGNLCVDFKSKNSVSISTTTNKIEFHLDSVFDCETGQEAFYKDVVQLTIEDILNGYNGTVFTYGQSGSGKTYTMFGDDIWDEEKKGVIPRSIDQIFSLINDDKNDSKFELTFSILEIYKENLFDLLNPNSKSQDIKIKEDPRKGIYVENITIASIEDKDELLILLGEAEENRSVAETKLNKLSSRSHIVFMLGIKQILNDGCEKIGTLNLVDLAGSEKVSKTGAIGETLEEAKKINFSLSCLGNVINCLASGRNSEFVPYRESKLTRLLKDSLGGNYKTTLIVTCSPHSFNVEETISTLMFANRAKNVKNRIKINLKKTAEEYERIIANLQLKLDGMKSTCITHTLTLQKSNTSKESMDDELLLTSPSSNTNYILLLKSKDEEINRLKEEIENLKIENKNLQDEMNNLKNNINYDEMIEKLEKSMKNNISDIDVSIRNYKNNLIDITTEENTILKEKLKEKQNSSIEEIKKVLKDDFKLDLNSRVQKVNETFKTFFDFLNSSNEKDNITFNTYEKAFNNTKIFLNDLMGEYLRKHNEIFLNDTGTKDTNDTLTIDRSVYQNLQSSYLQSNALCIFYEKILFDILGTLNFDLKKIGLQHAYYNQSSQKIQKINDLICKYLQILEETKKNKPSTNNNIANTSFGPGNISPNIIEKQNEDKVDALNRRFIRHVIKKSSKRVSGINLINSIISKKISEDTRQEIKVDSNFTALMNEITSSDGKHVEKSKFQKSMIGSINTLNEINDDTPKLIQLESEKIMSYEMILNDINPTTELKPFAENIMNLIESNRIPNQRNFKHIRLPFQKSKLTNGNGEIPAPLTRKSTTSFSNIFKNLKMNNYFQNNRTQYTASLISNNDVNINQCNQELKILKKEKTLYTQFINDLTNETIDLNQKINKIEKSYIEYQDYLKEIFKKELENIRLNFCILKDFYYDEINHSKSIIQELSVTIDDILLNHKLVFNKDNKNPGLIKQFYFERKESILEKINSGRNLSLVAEAMITDGGTATKKLDFVFIDLKDKSNEQLNPQKFKIIYGSGLDREIPTKCPLFKNLKYNLNGDTDFLTPEEY